MSVYIVLFAVYLIIAAVMYRSYLRSIRESVPAGYPIMKLIRPILFSETILLFLCGGVAVAALAYEWFDFFKDAFEQIRWLLIYALMCIMARIVSLPMLTNRLYRKAPSRAEWFRTRQRN